MKKIVVLGVLTGLLIFASDVNAQGRGNRLIPDRNGDGKITFSDLRGSGGGFGGGFGRGFGNGLGGLGGFLNPLLGLGGFGGFNGGFNNFNQFGYGGFGGGAGIGFFERQQIERLRLLRLQQQLAFQSQIGFGGGLNSFASYGLGASCYGGGCVGASFVPQFAPTCAPCQSSVYAAPTYAPCAGASFAPSYAPCGGVGAGLGYGVGGVGYLGGIRRQFGTGGHSCGPAAFRF